MSTDRWMEQPGATLAEPVGEDHEQVLAEARERIDQPGEYLCYEEHGELRTVALTREWTRIGRSLAADIRLDDPTVSRRHALIVRHPKGVRLLDDRSLNGVYVNDARVESRILKDGDQVIIGRYRLTLISVSQEQAEHASAADAPSFGGGD
jgi:pSer/pThr/pTyr-binding forkhead associated (FHA) protein